MSTNDLQLATRYGAEVSLYLLKVSKYFLENPGHQSVTLQLDHSEDEFIAFFEKEARSESYNFWLEPLPYVRLLKKIKIFRKRPHFISDEQVAYSELLYDRLVQSLGT